MNSNEYKNKKVVVTGCASGIGEATAGALIDSGAEVFGLDRNAPAIDVSTFVQVDLTDVESIAAAADRVGGGVTSLFNCAGASPLRPSLEIVQVNFLGVRLLTELLVPTMPAGSAIVNVSSDGGAGWRKKRELLLEFLAVDTFDDGAEWFAAHEEAAGHGYSFSKEALNAWTMEQSKTLIKAGIRINTTSPGSVQTPMLDEIAANFPPEMIEGTYTSIGRRSTAEEQVGPLLFLNSDAASYVNGADLAVDGGDWASHSIAGDLWA